jgi:hypothetical protein
VKRRASLVKDVYHNVQETRLLWPLQRDIPIIEAPNPGSNPDQRVYGHDLEILVYASNSDETLPDFMGAKRPSSLLQQCDDRLTLIDARDISRRSIPVIGPNHSA